MPYTQRPRYPKSDTKCPDGFACYGWRQVHKGGYVNWYGRKFWHEELAQWAGMWVWIEIADWLAIDLNVFIHGQPTNSHDVSVLAQSKESE